MAYDWIRVDISLPTHFKTKRLARALGGVERAYTYPLQLWWWCAVHARDGDISHLRPEEIAEICGWDYELVEDAEAFVTAMIDCGWIDNEPEDDLLIVHDWDEKNSAIAMKRYADRDRQKRKRQRDKRTADGDKKPSVRDDVTGKRDAVTGGCDCVETGHKNITPTLRDGTERNGTGEAHICDSFDPEAENETEDDGANAPAANAAHVPSDGDRSGEKNKKPGAGRKRKKDETPYDEIAEILNSTAESFRSRENGDPLRADLPMVLIPLGKTVKSVIAIAHGTKPSRADYAGVMQSDLERWKAFAWCCGEDDWWAGRDPGFSGMTDWPWAIKKSHQAFARGLKPRKYKPKDRVNGPTPLDGIDMNMFDQTGQ